MPAPQHRGELNLRPLVLVPLVLLAGLAVPAGILHAQGGAAPPAAGPGVQGAAGRGAVPNLTAAEPMGPVENLAAYPAPPEGFNVVRDSSLDTFAWSPWWRRRRTPGRRRN